MALCKLRFGIYPRVALLATDLLTKINKVD